MAPALSHLDINSTGYKHPKDRLEKMLVLIDLLKYRRRKTLAELAQILEKSERQIRRDIKLLEGFFDLDFDQYNRPFIFAEKNEDNIILEVTEEELALLSNLVKNSRHKLSSGLRSKLDKKTFIKEEISDSLAAIVDDIEMAINDKSQIKLKAYQSATSTNPRDITVEPITLTSLKYLAAYDVTDKQNKIFALERITKGIEKLNISFRFQDAHKHLTPDIFGIITGMDYEVILMLSTRAYLLMREEFPRSIPNLKPHAKDPDFPYCFEARLFGLEGVGRFVMGLPGQVKVVKPKEIQ